MAGGDSFSDDEDLDDEEKFERERLLEDAEDGRSVTMSEDLEQLRNAAEVVGEIVAVGHLHQNQQQYQQQSLPIPLAHSATSPAPAPMPVVEQVNINIPIASNTIPQTPHFEEELPAYEDNDGSDMSSIVSDGYRPGTLYTPSQSPNGSLSDILGPDRKS
ncbi:hypothetical protein IFR05_010421 [Cadophora sp. M221]|nr:hypothetical protein IFR05_010421 [Cadophora sp. M221]